MNGGVGGGLYDDEDEVEVNRGGMGEMEGEEEKRSEGELDEDSRD